MAIYKKYVRNYRAFLDSQDEFYNKFLQILKKIYESGVRRIPSDDLYFSIRRYSYMLFSSSTPKNNWDEKARRYYFKFWIKRAEKAGFIKQCLPLGWEIQEKILEVKDEDL